VFLTPHLGCFEITAQAAARATGAPSMGHHRAVPAGAPAGWLAEGDGDRAQPPGHAAVPTTLAGVRQMIKALRRGEAVGLLPDQVPPDGRASVGRPFLAAMPTP
jgi:KDO2-lipid IV(A) lauroyltransferase